MLPLNYLLTVENSKSFDVFFEDAGIHDHEQAGAA